MFKRIEADEAVIVESGIYKPTTVYEYEGGLYVAMKGGFARVKANGSTSHPKVRMEKLCRDGELYQDRFGRLRVDANIEGARRVELGADGQVAAVEDISGRGTKSLTNE